MKFILMMGMKNDAASQSQGIMSWQKQLKEAGEFVSAEGLAWPDQAKIVRAGKDGAPITDGVFPESKEFLIGYWIIDVENAERAYQVAARASAAPGKGGAPLNMPIEVRQIMAGPPKDFV